VAWHGLPPWCELVVVQARRRGVASLHSDACRSRTAWDPAPSSRWPWPRSTVAAADPRQRGAQLLLQAAVIEIHGGGSGSTAADLGQRRPNSLLSGAGKVAWRGLPVAVAEIQIQAATMD